MERSWLGHFHSLENHFFPELDAAISRGLYQLSYIGIMSLIDMTMRVMFGQQDRNGFYFFSGNYLKNRDQKYSVKANQKKLWQLRVGLTHGWITRDQFSLNAGGQHLQNAEEIFLVDVDQFFKDVKESLFQAWDDIVRDSERAEEANQRVAKLFGDQ